MIVLGIAAALWLRGRKPAAVTSTALGLPVAWWLSLPALMLIGLALGLAVYGPITAAFTVQHLAYRTLPLACGVWAVLTLVLVVVLRILRAQRQAG